MVINADFGKGFFPLNCSSNEKLLVLMALTLNLPVIIGCLVV